MGHSAYLDHLAIAAESWDDLWPRYRGELGGQWVSGGESWGFAPAQLRYANGMKIEALMPHMPERNDFLRRFLDRRGPGAHHVTFKVPDITAAIDQVETAGYRPVGIDLSDATWKEAFIHPKDGPGIVVQLAEAPAEWSSPAPAGFPPTSIESAATLDYIGLAVTDTPRAVELFVGLLDGELTGTGSDESFSTDYTDLRWSSGGVIRLFDAPQWIEQGERGRLHHAAFTVSDPQAMSEAKPLDDGRFEVAPEANLGVRLVMTAS